MKPELVEAVIQPAIPVFCIFLGFLLGLVPPWISRKRKRKTHWAALKAEVEKCKRNAEGFLEEVPHVVAPLPRLPVLYFQTSLPVLLAEEAVKAEDLTVLMEIFCQVQAFNRGLDKAEELGFKLGSEMDARLGGVDKRNKEYAQQVVSSCAPAMRAIEAHLKQSRLRSWRRSLNLPN